jgi:hypothetical protein
MLLALGSARGQDRFFSSSHPLPLEQFRLLYRAKQQSFPVARRHQREQQLADRQGVLSSFLLASRSVPTGLA